MRPLTCHDHQEALQALRDTLSLYVEMAERSVPDILPSSRAWRVKWRAQQPDQCG